MTAAILPTALLALGTSDTFRLDVAVETAASSAYLCRGQTVCDGWMNEQGVYLSNLYVRDTYVPLFGGYWGMMHLEPTPEENYHFGQWTEADYFCGLDFGRYLDDRLKASANFMICALPEIRQYDAMCAVNLDIGWRCWLNPKLHLRNRVLNAHAGKWEMSLSCGHRWELPKNFWTALRETCWAVDYHNVEVDTPASGFTSFVTRGTLGWKNIYIALDGVARLDPEALPHRRGQYYRPIAFSVGFAYAF